MMPDSSGAVLWGVSLRGRVWWVGVWFVNSGREHLVAIREVKWTRPADAHEFVCVVGGVVLGLVC